MDEQVHGHEPANDLAGRHPAGRTVHLFGHRLRVSGDLVDRLRGLLPGSPRVLVSAQGLWLPTPDTGDHAPMTLDHVSHHVAGRPLLARGLDLPLVRAHRPHRGIEAARHQPVTVLDLGHSASVRRLVTAPKVLNLGGVLGIPFMPVIQVIPLAGALRRSYQW